MELMGETLTYASRKVIKSQIFVDFFADWMRQSATPALDPS
jgi:hypothetical protein